MTRRFHDADVQPLLNRARDTKHYPIVLQHMIEKYGPRRSISIRDLHKWRESRWYRNAARTAWAEFKQRTAEPSIDDPIGMQP